MADPHKMLVAPGHARRPDGAQWVVQVDPWDDSKSSLVCAVTHRQTQLPQLKPGELLYEIGVDDETQDAYIMMPDNSSVWCRHMGGHYIVTKEEDFLKDDAQLFIQRKLAAGGYDVINLFSAATQHKAEAMTVRLGHAEAQAKLDYYMFLLPKTSSAVLIPLQRWFTEAKLGMCNRDHRLWLHQRWGHGKQCGAGFMRAIGHC